MELYDFDSIINKKIKKNPICLTIGVFEAFHIGHQAILEKLLEEKRRNPGSETMVITFSINPKPKRSDKIDTLRLREQNLSLFGIDSCVTIDFSEEFSRISASGFLKMIVSSMNLVAIAVGEDFQFGNPANAASAYDLALMLKQLGVNAKVDIVAPILMKGGEKISSTLLRRMIKEGRLEEFPRLSGQYYSLDLLKSPYVIEEDNLVYRAIDIHQLLPPQGAYDSILVLEDGNRYACSALIDESNLILKPGKVCIKGKDGQELGIEKLLLERKR